MSELFPLTSAERSLLLSLGALGLEDFLRPLPQEQRDSYLRQLWNHLEPKEAAEASLHEFVRQAWSQVENRPFCDNWHIHAICNHLEAVYDKRITNLLINVPPGCSKSLLTCVFWPSWVWINNPAARFLYASYEQSLATRDSMKMRYLMESPWFRERWGERVKLRADQNQKTRYDTTAGGWRIATTPSGRGTGEHPDYAIADDPHNVAQSESDVQRQEALDWWDGTVSLRGMTRGVSRVIIMQRLHEADLSGHVLKKGGFDHLCLPMEFEPDTVKVTSLGFKDPRTVAGEYLAPQFITPELVAEMKKSLVSQYRIAGQLQQRPVPAGGGMFRREWFGVPLPELPAGCREFVRYWDKAGTQDAGCNTAGVLMTKFEGLYYVVDVKKGQWSANAREQVIKQTAELDRGQYGHVQIWVEQEPGSGGKESAENTIRNLAGYSVRAHAVNSGDGTKEVRAQPLADQCEAGNVRLIAGAWNGSYIEELIAFPMATLKDQVDASSGAFNKLSLNRGFVVAGMERYR